MMELREALDRVPDHRKSQGRRHQLGAILSLAVCAMLCGARSLYAIAQWGRDPRSRHGATPGVQAGEDARCSHLPPGVQRPGRGRLRGGVAGMADQQWARAWGGAVPGRQDPAGDTRARDTRGASGVSLCCRKRGGVGPSSRARQGSGVGGGQKSAGAGPSGRPGSGGRRSVEATGSVPADCGRGRGLPVAGERESAHFAPRLGGSIFPHWKLRKATGQGCPRGRSRSGGCAGQR